MRVKQKRQLAYLSGDSFCWEPRKGLLTYICQLSFARKYTKLWVFRQILHWDLEFILQQLKLFDSTIGTRSNIQLICLVSQSLIIIGLLPNFTVSVCKKKEFQVPWLHYAKVFPRAYTQTVFSLSWYVQAVFKPISITYGIYIGNIIRCFLVICALWCASGELISSSKPSDKPPASKHNGESVRHVFYPRMVKMWNWLPQGVNSSAIFKKNLNKIRNRVYS